MATGAATDQLSRIDDTLGRMEAADIAYQTDTTFTFVSILDALNTGNGLLTEIRDALTTYLPTIATATVQTNGRVATLGSTASQILALLEIMNSNNALNAKNAQVLMIGQGSGCCDTLTVVDGFPERLCARSQAMWSWYETVIDTLCGQGADGIVPSVNELRDILRNDAWHSADRPMYTDAELATIQGAIQQNGPSSLSSLCGLAADGGTKATFIAAMTLYSTALEADAHMQGNLFASSGTTLEWQRFLRFLFPLSVINIVYDATVNINDDLYDNEVCGDPPETEPCTEYTDNAAIAGDFGSAESSWYRPTMSSINPEPAFGYWQRIIMRNNDDGSTESAELWRSDRVPTEKVVDLLPGVPYDFMPPAGSSASQFHIRFNTSTPESWEGGDFYHHLDSCQYWADGATSPIDPA